MAQISYHYNDVEYGENYTCYFGVPKAGTNVLADASDWTSCLVLVYAPEAMGAREIMRPQ